jgi:hypothetical protein
VYLNPRGVCPIPVRLVIPVALIIPLLLALFTTILLVIARGLTERLYLFEADLGWQGCVAVMVVSLSRSFSSSL